MPMLMHPSKLLCLPWYSFEIGYPMDKEGLLWIFSLYQFGCCSAKGGLEASFLSLTNHP